MDEERIFGPLTLRQFLILAVGVLFVFIVYTQTASGIGVPSSILIAATTLVMIFRFKGATINESYIQKKRSALPRDAFEKWIQKKIAMIESQKAIRVARGLPIDPELEQMSELFNESLEKKVSIKEFV
jgi:hypothetical protein